jgi:alpha-glucosidase
MSRTSRSIALLLIAAVPAFTQWHSIGNADTVIVRDREVECIAGSQTVRVSILADDLVRVRAIASRAFGPDRSVAVIKTDWNPSAVRVIDSKDSIVLIGREVTVTVRKRPVRIIVAASDGTVLSEDAPRGMAWDGAEVRVWKNRSEDEYYFGLGEKTGRLNRTGKSFTLWNSDIPAYRSDTDPLYQSVPFFIAVKNGRAYGIFFDNTYRSSFDFGTENPGRYAFGALGGEMNYYVFAGTTPKAILSRFTDLVGRMPLPPRWALGYQQCRWSYAPESRVRSLAKTFREKRMPCDVIYLDIDYMEGYRVFTWSGKNFPQPKRLLNDLANDGFKVVTIIDPGIKADSAYHAFRSGMSADAFLKYSDGRTYLGKVWPGTCAFPDFSKASACEWWGRNFAGMLDDGVRGFWNDMNEPSVFDVPTKTVDLDVIHDDDGLRTTHAKNHNSYGLLMTRATYEGVRALRPNERPFVLTRASYAGGQRYTAAWTGDNVSSWEHLQLAVAMCLGMSISGQPFVGSDIGGFIGTSDGELYARWLQLGVFSPLMRTHKVINGQDQEPWSYGPVYESINRATLELRYRLLPYIYQVMQNASETGIPAMRPLIFEYPEEAEGIWNDSEFLFGNDLLVAPVLGPGERTRELRLPPGIWYDYWTRTRYVGGKNVHVPAPIDRIPIFVRAGAIIPTQQVVQFVDQSPADPLTFTVFPADSSRSRSYEDDGRSFEYQSGSFIKRSFEQTRSSGALRLRISPAEGTYPLRRFVDVSFVDVGSAPDVVRLSGKALSRTRGTPKTEGWYYDSARKCLVVRLHDVRTELVLEADLKDRGTND